jgi:hypothetical protein
MVTSKNLTSAFITQELTQDLRASSNMIGVAVNETINLPASEYADAGLNSIDYNNGSNGTVQSKEFVNNTTRDRKSKNSLKDSQSSNKLYEHYKNKLIKNEAKVMNQEKQDEKRRSLTQRNHNSKSMDKIKIRKANAAYNDAIKSDEAIRPKAISSKKMSVQQLPQTHMLQSLNLQNRIHKARKIYKENLRLYENIQKIKSVMPNKEDAIRAEKKRRVLQ